MSAEAKASRVGSAVLMTFLALLLIVAGVATSANTRRLTTTPLVTSLSSTSPKPTAISGLYFDYIVTILLENQNLCSVYYGNASGSPCGTSPTPGVYETGLSNNYSIPLDYRYCNVNPSLPNYLCLSGASQFGCSGIDTSPNSGCAQAAWPAKNIVDLLVNGSVTWKAYMEDMPSNCDGSNSPSGLYAVRHDPFVYYQNNVAPYNTTRCGQIVPAGPTSGSDSALLNDLNSTSTASNYMWLTPNVNNDGHDTGVAGADAHMSALIPLILNSPIFTTKRAALFLVYDEGYSNPTYATWAGPVVKNYFNTSKTTYYDAFSYLKTIETNWNLQSLNANDSGATPMSVFFKSFTPPSPDYSVAASSTHVYYAPGGSGETNITIQPSNGFSGSVALSGNSSPTGVSSGFSPSSITPGQTSLCTFSGGSLGNYTVTVNGTSGSLSHTLDVQVTVTNSIPPTTSMLPAGTQGSNGWYTTTVVVTLTATNLAGGTIWYTLDGGGWTAYSNPFTLSDGAHTVQYNGTSGTGAVESTHTGTVDVDTAPPVVTAVPIGVNGTNGWFTSGVVLTLTATDSPSGVASVTYTLDGGSPQSYAAPFGITDGVHTVVYSATDRAGLQSTAATLTLKIDSAAPVFNSVAPSGVLTNGTVTVTWNATDTSGIVDYKVRVDNATPQDVHLSTSLQLTLADGHHTIQVIATDGAGLSNAAVIQFQVNAGSSGGTPASSDTLLLLLPLILAVVIIAGAGITLFVLVRRRNRPPERRQD